MFNYQGGTGQTGNFDSQFCLICKFTWRDVLFKSINIQSVSDVCASSNPQVTNLLILFPDFPTIFPEKNDPKRGPFLRWASPRQNVGPRWSPTRQWDVDAEVPWRSPYLGEGSRQRSQEFLGNWGKLYYFTGWGPQDSVQLPYRLNYSVYGRYKPN